MRLSCRHCIPFLEIALGFCFEDSGMVDCSRVLGLAYGACSRLARLSTGLMSLLKKRG